jgi:hypothetical protein
MRNGLLMEAGTAQARGWFAGEVSSTPPLEEEEVQKASYAAAEIL